MARKESYLLPIFDLGRLNQMLNSIGRRLDGVEGMRQGQIDDLKADYIAGDLDTEAEMIVAINTTNSRVNAIVAALQNYGTVARDEK